MDDAPHVSSIPIVDREKTAPFLVRAFVKIGGFHRHTLFEDGQLPTTDERQIFTWRDATLKELVHNLRLTVPQTSELRHPLARFSFRALFLDPERTSARSLHYTTKDLGSVSAREAHFNSEPSVADPEPEEWDRSIWRGSDRTLEELKFFPGDIMAVALLLPKSRADKETGAPPPMLSGANGAGRGDRGDRLGAMGAPQPTRGGGGHWRGGPGGARGGGNVGRGSGRPSPPPRAGADRPSPPPRGGRDSPPPPRRGRSSPPSRNGGGRFSPPPPRRSSPPPNRRDGGGGGFGGGRGGRGGGRGGFDRDRGGRFGDRDRDRDGDRDKDRDRERRRSRSRSRSRSPPPRRW